MIYKYEGNFVEGIFKSRPNRFIAEVLIDGEVHKAHVKNTSRLKELITPGNKVYLKEADNPNRKTKYDLISIFANNRWVNIDSQIPNTIVYNAFKNNLIKGWENPIEIKREVSVGNSRLDMKIIMGDTILFTEVKSVDFLVNKNIATFPGAPTERGRRHLRELEKLVKKGYNAMSIYLIVREEAEYFRPGYEIDKEYSKIFYEVKKSGVEARAYICNIGPDYIEFNREIPILNEAEMMKTIDEDIIEWS